MTEELFKKIKSGISFAGGVCNDLSNELHMTGNGQKLRWVAVKGGANDWAIYVGRAWQSQEEVRTNGDKTTMKSNILYCLPKCECILKYYRY